MPITEAAVERRQKYIGASDFPAILGLSPWKTCADVIAEKQGRVEKWDGNERTKAGNRFEDGVLDEAQEIFGPLVRNQFRVYREDGVPIGSNCDAILVANNRPVEGKTAGLFGPLVETWGEDGTDEVPDMYLVQVQAQMLCCEAEVGHLMAFIGGRGFAHFTIKRNEELLKIMLDKAAKAWEHVKAGTFPDNAPLSLEICKRFRRVPAKVVSIPASLKTAYDEAQESYKAAEEKFETVKTNILTALSVGEAEAGEIPGVGSFTYMEQGRSGIDAKRLKSEKPEIAAAYETETRFRVLRFKKAK